MDKRDVIIVGGGIFGLSCAYACVRRGLTVRLLEGDRLASGASGGVVGALSPHVPDAWNPKKAFQFRALTMAPRFWADIGRFGNPGYRAAGRLMPILSQHALEIAHIRQQGARDLWQGQAQWRVYPPGHAAALINPKVAPVGVIHDTLAAHIFPRAACDALGHACAALGVDIQQGWRVDDITQGQVAGPKGTASAEMIIVAAGVPGFALLEPKGGLGRGVKGQSALLDAQLPKDMPTLFADGIYVVPHGSRGTAVGSTSENDWTGATTTDGQLDDVVRRARDLCPALEGANVTERWAGLRPKARRRDPLLGPIPGQPGVLAALGGFKIGFGIAPLVGEVLADFAQGRAPDVPDSFGFAHHAP